MTAPAEGGRANEAALDLLARTLAVSRHDLSLEVGASSRDKVVVLEGLSGDVVDERLSTAAERGG